MGDGELDPFEHAFEPAPHQRRLERRCIRPRFIMTGFEDRAAQQISFRIDEFELGELLGMSLEQERMLDDGHQDERLACRHRALEAADHRTGEEPRRRVGEWITLRRVAAAALPVATAEIPTKIPTLRVAAI